MSIFDITEFNAGHHIFTIVRKALGDVWGITKIEDFTIVIDSSLSESDYKDVLIHEILHVILYNSGMADSDDIPKELTNEFLVSILANQIVTLKNLNRQLFKELFNYGS